MSLALGVPHSDHPYRPSLQRSRSHSTPSRNPKPTESDETPPRRPQRPTHGRSQSYLSPVSSKPQKASTAPAEERSAKNHRIHLPGKHHLHRDENRKHRHTQSEVEQHQRLRRHHGDTDSLPHLLAGLKREGEKRGAGDHTANPDMIPSVPGGLTRMMSTRSYRGHTNTDGNHNEALTSKYGYDLRRRATSDPKQPSQVVKKSPIEEELERADRIRRQRRFTITKADVARRDTEIAAAEDELRERLEDVNAKGMSMTRRLDYGYYNLLEKVGNLIGTIQSFQSLAQQSKQLISNFEHETDRVEGDMEKRIRNFRHTFEQREARVERLESRGQTLSRKAEDLGKRLETARSMVESWEKKESQARKVWGRFWGGIWWTFVTITILILAIVIAKEWWFKGDPVKAALRMPAGGSHNASLSLGEGRAGDAKLAEVDLPDDVRSVLEGIKERNKRRKEFFVKPVARGDREEADEVDDESFRVLDEL